MTDHTSFRRAGQQAITLAAVSLLLVASPAGAQDRMRDTATSTPRVIDRAREEAREMKDRMQAMATGTRERATQAKDRLSEMRENMQERRGVKREQMEENARTRIQNFMERTLRRFEAAIERLDRLGARIESRIIKFEEQGFVLTKAKDKLAEARTAIAQARDAVADVRNSGAEISNAEDPRAMFSAVRDLLNDAKESIKAAHAALVDSIVEIKGVVKDKGNGTTTEQTAE